MRGCFLWDYVERDITINNVPPNPTLAQIKLHEEAVVNKARTLSCLHSAVIEELFMMIITWKTANEAWDKLAAEFKGDDRPKNM